MALSDGEASSIPGFTVVECVNAHLSLDEARAERSPLDLERIRHWENHSASELKAACASAGLQTTGSRKELILKLALYKGLPKELPPANGQPLHVVEVDNPAGAPVTEVLVTVPVSVPRGRNGKMPQPRGRPRKGKLWDSTAGEWVDDPDFVDEPKAYRKKRKGAAAGAPEADGATEGAPAATAQRPGGGSYKARLPPGHAPQPRGRPRKGKLWDSAQGAWVDDPDYVETAGTPGKKRARVAAPGGAPAEDGEGANGFAAAPGAEASTPSKLARRAALSPGQTPQPRGRPRSGMIWNFDDGRWDPDPNFQAKAKGSRSKKAKAPEGAEAAAVVEITLDDAAGAPAAEEGAAAAAPGKKVSKENKTLGPGKKPQPRGRPRKGKTWDPDLGEWVDKPRSPDDAVEAPHPAGPAVVEGVEEIETEEVDVLS